MVGGHFFHSIHTGCPQCIDFRQIMDILLLQHFNKFHKNMCRTLCIIHGSVMVLQRYPQSLRYRIQGML